MDLLVPETVDSRYKVLDVIGTGAMATVYAAEDTRLGRKVAMKILRSRCGLIVLRLRSLMR